MTGREASRRTCGRGRLAGLLLPAAMLVAGLQLPSPAAAFDWPALETTPAEKKRFTLIRHYAYRERRFDPPWAVRIMEEAPSRHVSPEAVVVAQVSARAKEDFDWWLSTWDEPARAALLANEPDPAKWLERWRLEGTPERVELVRWLEVGQRVVVSWRAAGSPGGEQGLLLALQGGSWHAVLPEPNFPDAATWIGGAQVERTVR